MYATADDMRARYTEAVLVQLTNAASWDATAIAAINVKLASATARADGWVSKYYAPAPGTAVPPLLVEIVCEIAFADLQPVPTEESINRRKAAIGDLREIAKGHIKLDGGDTTLLAARPGAVIVPDRQRTFSRDSLGSF